MNKQSLIICGGVVLLLGCAVAYFGFLDLATTPYQRDYCRFDSPIVCFDSRLSVSERLLKVEIIVYAKNEKALEAFNPRVRFDETQNWTSCERTQPGKDIHLAQDQVYFTCLMTVRNGDAAEYLGDMRTVLFDARVPGWFGEKTIKGTLHTVVQ